MRDVTNQEQPVQCVPCQRKPLPHCMYCGILNDSGSSRSSLDLISDATNSPNARPNAQRPRRPRAFLPETPIDLEGGPPTEADFEEAANLLERFSPPDSLFEPYVSVADRFAIKAELLEAKRLIAELEEENIQLKAQVKRLERQRHADQWSHVFEEVLFDDQGGIK